MSGLNRLRTATILIFVLLSAAVFLAWYTTDLFPWLHTAALLSIVIIVCVWYIEETSPIQAFWAVSMFCVIGVTLRAPMVLFTGTLSSNDPEKYALFAHLTLESGSARLPTVSFYGVAGGFHTYIAQTAAIAGVSTEAAMVVIAVLFGMLGPLLAASYCLLLVGNNHHGYTATIIAGSIAAVAAASLRLSYVPIAQSVGTMLLLTFVLVMLRHLRLSPDDRQFNWVLIVLLLFGMAFSHKIPVLIASVLVTVGWIATKITTINWLWPRQPSRVHIPLSLSLISILIAMVQQTYVTAYVTQAFDHAESTAESSLQAPTRLGTHPEAATVVDVGLLAPFQSHSHAPVTLAVAGLAWLAVMWIVISRDSTDDTAVPIVFLLSIATLTSFVLVTIGGGGVLSNAPNPMRFQVLQEPLLAALIGTGYIVVCYSLLTSETNRKRFTAVFSVVLLVLVLFHAFTVVGSPDYPGQERQHLTEGEVAGKEFAYDHVETTVWTDNRLQRETPHREALTDKASPWVQLGAPPRDTQFSANNIQLLEGTATEPGYDTVLYRSNAQTYSSRGEFRDYRYTILWDVEQSADERYHRSYDNGHATTHRYPNT